MRRKNVRSAILNMAMATEVAERRVCRPSTLLLVCYDRWERDQPAAPADCSLGVAGHLACHPLPLPFSFTLISFLSSYPPFFPPSITPSFPTDLPPPLLPPYRRAQTRQSREAAVLASRSIDFDENIRPTWSRQSAVSCDEREGQSSRGWCRAKSRRRARPPGEQQQF